MTTLCLRSHEKLKDSAQFKTVQKHGSKLTGQCFLILQCDNSEGFPRLGVTVSKKTSKKATVRNRIKRIIRESFRMQKQYLPAVDIVVISRKKAGQLPADQLRQDLAKLWQQLIV